MRLAVETDNAAFEGENFTAECARILRKLADDMEKFHDKTDASPINVRDANGNTVGTFEAWVKTAWQN